MPAWRTTIRSTSALCTLDGQGFTIEAWFYVPDLSGEGLQTLIYKQSAYALFINFHTNQADQLFLRLWSPELPSPGYITLFPTASSLSVGWHHAAAVFDNLSGPNDTGAIYLDGSRIGLGSGLSFSPGIGNSSSALNIGSYLGVNPVHGWIDEVRLSDVVRYSGLSYTVPGGDFGSDVNTRALWHFNEAVGSTSFADASGNGNTLTGLNGAQTVNPVGDPLPTVQSITRSAPSGQFTSASSVVYRVTFSEHVNNVSTADFTLVDVSGTITGEFITSVNASSGTTIDVTVNTGTSGNGSLRLDVLAGTAIISDDVGNSLNASFTNGQVYNIDRTFPTVLSVNRFSPANQLTSAASVVYRVNFSEHVNNVSTADFTLVDVSGTITGEFITSVNASSGTTIDVTVNTGTSGNGVLQLNVLAGIATIMDDTGNSLSASFTSGQVYNIDRTSPTVLSINRFSPTNQLTTAASVIYRVTFSEHVNNVSTNDFTLIDVSGVITGESIASVNATSGTTIDVTANTGSSGEGNLRFDVIYPGATITDDADNVLNASFTTGQVYTVSRALSFLATSPLATARYHHTATLLPNGNVLVAGGYNGGSLSSAEIYDPTTGTWTVTGVLTTARSHHAATLLANGKVLITGGWNSFPGNGTSSAEIYDPATGTSMATAAMTTMRAGHTAILLPDGNVLV